MPSFLVFTVSDGKKYIQDVTIKFYAPGSPKVEGKTDARGKLTMKLPHNIETVGRYFIEYQGEIYSTTIQTMERSVDGSVNIDVSKFKTDDDAPKRCCFGR